MEKKDVIHKLLANIKDDTLHSIFTDEEVENLLKIKEEKYPRFKLSLSAKEIEDMKNEGILNDEYKISPEIFDGKSRKKPLTPLEKLLLSVIWKNGDYGKEKYIIEGIRVQENLEQKDIPNRFVFWNFGRYLVDKTKPIVDRHTAKAYREIEKNKTVANKNKADYEHYIEWFKKVIDKDDFKEFNKEDVAYYLDLLLFEYGKELKKIERN
ncbi:hypothetical protein TREVI0001_0251 [Treponema vincentii ATCC 35580]|uniref:Uncharacterized protein n=1 Tax=Treponema vincentii ATCC 35580 TaxID=596324 RepID=C8PU08_9SPIR|nr:hypothetical protein [Treponema vincentii]EEV19147.1 hypothetical protein TREVI0001_0251 [Treponema vincentii ATCC 35580]